MRTVRGGRRACLRRRRHAASHDVIHLGLLLLFIVIIAAGFFGTAYEGANRYARTICQAREAGRLDIVREIRGKVMRHGLMWKTIAYFVKKKLGPNWDR